MKPRNHHSIGARILGALKWIIPLVIVGALVALAFRPQPVNVDIGVVSKGAMMLTVDEDGQTQLRERYTVDAPLGGRLLRTELDAGTPITKGQTLATIVASPTSLLDERMRTETGARVSAARAASERAVAQWRAAEENASQLESSYNRNKTLHEKGNLASAKFEESEAKFLAAGYNVRAAELAVDVAKFELAQAEAALVHEAKLAESPDEEAQNFVISSPIQGRVLRVHEESSRIVQPGTSLLEIGDPSDLELKIDVLSQDAVKIKPNQEIILEHWGGDKPLRARVRMVEPSAYTKVSALGVDEQRVDVIADLEGELPEGTSLGDAYRVEARIIIWESKEVLRVPAGALFRHGKSWAVYLADGERARLREIEIGRNNGEVAEVISGLDPGDQVILHPGDRIEDESLIEATPE